MEAAVWEEAFVVVSVLCGASLSEAEAALTPEATARTASLRAQLTDAKKTTRAKALAGTVRELVVALDEVALR